MLSSDFYMCAMAHACPHTHTHKVNVISFLKTKPVYYNITIRWIHIIHFVSQFLAHNSHIAYMGRDGEIVFLKFMAAGAEETTQQVRTHVLQA